MRDASGLEVVTLIIAPQDDKNLDESQVESVESVGSAESAEGSPGSPGLRAAAEPTQVTISTRIAPPAAARPVRAPFEIGGRYWLRTSARRDGIGFMMWDASAEPVLVFVLSIDGGLTDDVLPGVTIVVPEAERPLYTDVRMLSSGCTIALEHREVIAKTAAGALRIQPGGRGSVVADSTWDLVVLDASRPDSRRAPTGHCGPLAHVSWAATLAASRASRPEP